MIVYVFLTFRTHSQDFDGEDEDDGGIDVKYSRKTYEITCENIQDLADNHILHLRVRMASLLATCCFGNKAETEVTVQRLYDFQDLCDVASMTKDDKRWGTELSPQDLWDVKEVCTRCAFEVFVETEVPLRNVSTYGHPQKSCHLLV